MTDEQTPAAAAGSDCEYARRGEAHPLGVECDECGVAAYPIEPLRLCCPHCNQSVNLTDAAALRAQSDRPSDDSARLDWLGAQIPTDVAVNLYATHDGKTIGLFCMAVDSKGDTLRAAIDAGRASSPSPRTAEERTEQWRPVDGWGGVYEVSSMGRVRRSARVLVCTPNHKGYLRADMQVGSRRVSCFVHRLVAGAFIGPCPDGQQVNHRDRNNRNNLVENLEYVTPRENDAHARRAGGRASRAGEWHGNARLTWEQVAEIRQLRATGARIVDLRKRFGVSRGTIEGIIYNRTWRSVPVDQSAGGSDA